MNSRDLHRTLLSRSITWFDRTLLLPLSDRVTGSRMMQRLKFLETAQYWPRERVREEQTRLLQNVLRLAYREVPFYHELFDRHRVDVDTIRSAADLVRLPIVTKDLFRKSPENSLTRPTGQAVYRSYTSGSTGKNFFVFEDARTAGWYRATFLLTLEWAGWHIGDRHLQTGMNLDRDFQRRMKDMLLRSYYVSAFDLSDKSLSTILDIIERKNILHVFGYPGSLYYLALRAQKVGWNTKLRSLVSWGDNLLPTHRALIESTFRTKVYDSYGCAEGFQVAAQCGHNADYHLHDFDVVVEYVREDGSPADRDAMGGVVVTRLEAGPMPLIRYRTGDAAVRGSSDVCSCGRSLGRMAAIRGRESDVIVTPGGNRLIVHFFTGILEHFKEVESFQVVQHEQDAITVRVVPAQPGWSASTGDLIRQSLVSKGADGMNITVQPVNSIPLTNAGKRKFVVSYSAPVDTPVQSIS